MVRRRFAGAGPALRQGQRRKTEWFGAADVGVSTVLAANTVILDQVLTTAEKAKRPFTVVRVRGMLWVGSDQVVTQEEVQGALGFSVVTDQAVAVGITAVPLPIFDSESDEFFVWQPFFNGQQANVGSPFGMAFEFDSKAMRKVSDGQDIAVVMENGSDSFGLQYLIQFRLLVKLH